MSSPKLKKPATPLVASLAVARTAVKSSVKSRGAQPIEPPADCLAHGAKTLHSLDAIVAQREAAPLREVDPYASTDMVRGYLLGLHTMSEWQRRQQV